MNLYENYFKRILKEADAMPPDISRDPDAIQFDDELSPEAMDQFNVDPADPNVGFQKNNVHDDVVKLKNIIDSLNKISSKIKDIGGDITSLERSFNGISNATNGIGGINGDIIKMTGELEEYIITLPAQVLKQKKEQEKEQNEIGGF